MTRPKPLPPADELRRRFRYEPDSGKLISRRYNRPVGYQVGGGKKYLRVEVDGGDFKLHRVVWKMVTGRDPVEQIDHRNGDPTDNRWENLREANNVENRRNSKNYGAQPKGVRRHADGGFEARIRLSQKERIYLGYYTTPEEAADAYAFAADLFFGEFARTE